MTDIEDLDLVSITLSKEERFVKELDARRVEYYPLKNKNTSPSTNSSFDSKEKFNKAFNDLIRQYKYLNVSKSFFHNVYTKMLQRGDIPYNFYLETQLKKRAVRSWSGVLTITVVMRPDQFSCPFNCMYCPDERKENGADVDMPRSYLSSEDAVRRASQVDFDTVKQVYVRLQTLKDNGHPIDKLEIIVLGGTFSSYPREYQHEFIRDIFYAANTFDREYTRSRYSLVREQSINEESKIHIIGLCLETRPDCITNQELRRFRHYGCTRVQIGVQHTDNAVLEYINRGHTVETSIKAIKLLKDWGFKVDIHIMPDLPGSSFEKDYRMIHELLTTSNFQPDHYKWYPCLDASFSPIRLQDWKGTGKWKPYAEENGGADLIKLVLNIKANIPPWIRINRIQRDFPNEGPNRVGYQSKNIRTNFRQEIQDIMKRESIVCKCIRCREIKDTLVLEEPVMKIREYKASGGIEYFISYETEDESILFGFIRLRILPKFENHRNRKHWCKELRGIRAIVRELHVYGSLQKVSSHNFMEDASQHRGLGKNLLKKAEEIALGTHDLDRIAVISGVGVRNYYRKWGYVLDGTYMTKQLSYTHFISYINYPKVIAAFLLLVVLGMLSLIAILLFFCLRT